MFIPEKDRVCLNCKYLCAPMGDDDTCGGRACENWSDRYTENLFEPDEDYIRHDLAKCENCRHFEEWSYCAGCRRLEREDLWEEELC